MHRQSPIAVLVAGLYRSWLAIYHQQGGRRNVYAHAVGCDDFVIMASYSHPRAVVAWSVCLKHS